MCLPMSSTKPRGLGAGGGGAWIWGLVGGCTGHDLTYTDLQNSCPSPSISNDLDDNHHQKTTPKSNRCMRDGGNQMQQNGEKQPKRIGSPQREKASRNQTLLWTRDVDSRGWCAGHVLTYTDLHFPAKT